MNLWRTTPVEPPPRPPAEDPGWPPPLWPARRPSVARPWLNLLLLAGTVVTTTAAGAMQQGVDPFAGWDSLVHLTEGLPFAAALLLILAVHEFGHYFAARRWGVKASLPYFLPLPYVSFLGTLGAVIRLRSPIPHKRALLDIGAAGPLAGLVVALAACLIGLPQSRLVDASYFYGPPLQLGAPLLFQALSALLLPQVGPEQMVLLHPVAFAGWVGLFITAFNLIPVGQLDGGHIAYALFARGHRYIARAFFGALLALGTYGILAIAWNWRPGWPGWLVLALFLGLFGRDHPAPYDASLPLDPRRRRLGYLCLLAFALCFTPVPFST